jgi:methionyl-tRNA formyltransferase
MDRGTRLAVKAATVVPNSDMTTQAGQVLDADLTIKCGQDALRLDILQRPGKAALPRADFLRGYDLSAGTLLGQGDDTL